MFNFWPHFTWQLASGQTALVSELFFDCFDSVETKFHAKSKRWSFYHVGIVVKSQRKPKMPALGSRQIEGYWGQPTSTLDWCEQNYEVIFLPNIERNCRNCHFSAIGNTTAFLVAQSLSRESSKVIVIFVLIIHDGVANSTLVNNMFEFTFLCTFLYVKRALICSQSVATVWL